MISSGRHNLIIFLFALRLRTPISQLMFFVTTAFVTSQSSKLAHHFRNFLRFHVILSCYCVFHDIVTQAMASPDDAMGQLPFQYRDH